MALGMLPIELLMVGDASLEPDGSMRVLLQVPNNSLGSVKVPLQGSSPVMQKRHAGLCDIESAQGDGPLHGPNQTLELFGLNQGTQVGRIQLGVVVINAVGVRESCWEVPP